MPPPFPVNPSKLLCTRPSMLTCPFRAVLEGLEANPNVQSVSLNLSLNDLAQTQDEYALGRHISSTKCLTALDISSCGLEDEAITEYVSAASLNPSLKHLSIGGNFSKSTYVGNTTCVCVCVVCVCCVFVCCVCVLCVCVLCVCVCCVCVLCVCVCCVRACVRVWVMTCHM